MPTVRARNGLLLQLLQLLQLLLPLVLLRLLLHRMREQAGTLRGARRAISLRCVHVRMYVRRCSVRGRQLRVRIKGSRVRHCPRHSCRRLRLKRVLL